MEEIVAGFLKKIIVPKTEITTVSLLVDGCPYPGYIYQKAEKSINLLPARKRMKARGQPDPAAIYSSLDAF